MYILYKPGITYFEAGSIPEKPAKNEKQQHAKAPVPDMDNPGIAAAFHPNPWPDRNVFGLFCPSGNVLRGV